ncbi:hypothetical protein K490DRAFT_37086 [Saccharata proteae CBS 121410]|uniref:Uncharacterized protein n=1 Tax=Saccharata proteae CBS 121410 TaxID=1314787 RepID=A0A6A5YE25_9PEZI|nr:hypothetical protein K490DRAFT_37086 [Saccharata proteae CBS 121410]
MRYALAPLAFGLGASAAILPRSDCCFQLTSSGGVSGSMSQLSDGQNRVGGSGGSAATYCINNGAITDSNGRGCILTGATTQFQCDSGSSPTTGFSISSSGELEYNGSGTFYACPATDTTYNIYTQPVEGQSKCVQIELSTGGKCASGSGSSAVSTPQAASTPAASAQQSTPAASVAHSPVAESSPVAETSAPAASTPAYTAPAASSPAYSAPQESESVTASSPAYTAPQQTTETVQASTSVATVPAASSPAYTAPAESSTVAASSAPVSSATSSTVAESSPAASSPVASVVSSTVVESSPAASSPVASAASSTVAASTSAGATTAAATPSSSSGICPTDLAGDYQYPHLLVPVNSTTPNTAYGTQYFGTISSTVCSTYNFDIPANYTGLTCTLEFLFPLKSELETSDFTVSGSGEVTFSELSSPVSESTTYDTVPSTEKTLGSYNLAPGNSYVIQTGECKAGQTIAYEICGSGSFYLNYFQDWNPSPIGLFERAC